ncbi:MAG: hypothetical protein AB1627_09515 [Chloroflexota bacterium]
MRSGLVVTGVLGLGTGLVFAAAALAATLFPNGAMVAGGSSWVRDSMLVQPAPVLVDDAPVRIDDDAWSGGIALPEQGPALPGPGTIVRR